MQRRGVAVADRFLARGCRLNSFEAEGSLDQIVCSPPVARSVVECCIGDFPFLLEKDEKYGGFRPKRTYNGPRYNDGYSDHLPLIVRFDF